MPAALSCSPTSGRASGLVVEHLDAFQFFNDVLHMPAASGCANVRQCRISFFSFFTYPAQSPPSFTLHLSPRASTPLLSLSLSPPPTSPWQMLRNALIDNLFAPLYIYSLAGAASPHVSEVESVRPVVGMYLLAQALMTFDDKALVDALVATILMADPSLGQDVDDSDAVAADAAAGDGPQGPPPAAESSAADVAATGAAARKTPERSYSVDSEAVAVYGEAFYLAIVDLMSCAESDFTALPAVCMLQAMVENAGGAPGCGRHEGGVESSGTPFLFFLLPFSLFFVFFPPAHPDPRRHMDRILHTCRLPPETQPSRLACCSTASSCCRTSPRPSARTTRCLSIGSLSSSRRP